MRRKGGRRFSRDLLCQNRIVTKSKAQRGVLPSRPGKALKPRGAISAAKRWKARAKPDRAGRTRIRIIGLGATAIEASAWIWSSSTPPMSIFISQRRNRQVRKRHHACVLADSGAEFCITSRSVSFGSTGCVVRQALYPPANAAASKPSAISRRATRALVASLGQVQ